MTWHSWCLFCQGNFSRCMMSPSQRINIDVLVNLSILFQLMEAFKSRRCGGYVCCTEIDSRLWEERQRENDNCCSRWNFLWIVGLSYIYCMSQFLRRKGYCFTQNRSGSSLRGSCLISDIVVLIYEHHCRNKDGDWAMNRRPDSNFTHSYSALICPEHELPLNCVKTGIKVFPLSLVNTVSATKVIFLGTYCIESLWGRYLDNLNFFFLKIMIFWVVFFFHFRLHKLVVLHVEV